MDSKAKFSVTAGLVGVGVILGNWAHNMLNSAGTPFSAGRVSMILSLYGIVLAYSLWKMFKPPNMRLPEFKKRNLVKELPHIPVDTSDPMSFMHWSPTAENLDDYSEKVKKFKEKKARPEPSQAP